MTRPLTGLPIKINRPSLSTAVQKKRAVGLLLFLVILSLFFAFNRFPKLDIVGGDLSAVTAPEVQCFQGFCVEREPGSNLLTRWWVFSITYLRLITVGMTFAFLVAGLTESFLFPDSSGTKYVSGGLFKRTLKGLAVGPVMNLCSACIVPVSRAYQRRGGGIEGAIAMVQGSATLNIPALAMVFFVFTPLLGVSRLVLALVGALILGPIVVLAVRSGRRDADATPAPLPIQQYAASSPWRPALTEAFRDWARTSIGYLVRMGPIMIVAGFASGLAIQWISPETVSEYLGNDLLGVAIAATLGIAINVPLLFEIPLVALLLLLGMGTAPAATLLFAAAAGGPVTFWGLARIMPRRATVAFASATWALGVVGGLGVLAIGALVWDDGATEGLRSAQPAVTADATVTAAPPPSRGPITVDGAPSFSDVTLSAGVDFVHRRAYGGIVPGSPGSEVVETVEGSALDVNTGAGALVLDFNNDGFQDIYVTNSEGPNALYRNDGDGTFTDVAVAAGVDDPQGVGNGGCAADYDNDGDQDLFVTSFGSSKLFRNDGDGRFTDATAAAAVDDFDVKDRSTGCAWGDYDRDGLLDLIVVRHLARWEPSFLDRITLARHVRSLALYHNNGDGSLTNVTPLLGDTLELRDGDGKVINNISGAGYQPGWVDFDNDGDLDLYVVNDYGQMVQPNVLWRNEGPAEDGTWAFLDVSDGSGADVNIDGMGLAVGDYDLDGFLDFYMTNTNQNALLRNNGDGLTFSDATVDAGAEIGVKNKQSVDWATMFFDYDNDGLEDLYIVSGFLKGLIHGNPVQQPNILLRNNGDGTFSDVSARSGADDEGIGRGGVYLDFNNDGCLDLFVANLGQSARLLQNACGDNGWLEIKTVGSASNRDGIGARITVVAGGTSQIREISGGSSQMGQNMMEAHFGLGSSTVADSVTIRWPSGKVQTLTDLAANRRVTVIEPR